MHTEDYFPTDREITNLILPCCEIQNTSRPLSPSHIHRNLPHSHLPYSLQSLERLRFTKLEP